MLTFIFSSISKVFSAEAWLQAAKSRNEVVTRPEDVSIYLKNKNTKQSKSKQELLVSKGA